MVALKNGEKVALLKEHVDGEWTVFQYSNRQTYSGKSVNHRWTEEDAKNYVLLYIAADATFEEKC